MYNKIHALCKFCLLPFFDELQSILAYLKPFVPEGVRISGKYWNCYEKNTISPLQPLGISVISNSIMNASSQLISTKKQWVAAGSTTHYKMASIL